MKIISSLLTLYIFYHLYIIFFVLLPTIFLLVLFIIVVVIGGWIHKFAHRNDYANETDRVNTEYMNRELFGQGMSYAERLEEISMGNTVPAGRDLRIWAAQKLNELKVE